MIGKEVRPLVHNVVAFALFTNAPEGNLDLQLIASKVSGSRLNKKKFPALMIRFSKPRGTFMMFRNGKVIVAGCECEEDSRIIVLKMKKILEKSLGIKSLKLKNYQVVNMMATCQLGYKINIGLLAQERCVHKDDTFPGAVYHLEKPIKSATIYSSGKVNMAGAKNRQQLEETFDLLVKLMKPFALTN